jgi:hypothetical protein
MISNSLVGSPLPTGISISDLPFTNWETETRVFTNSTLAISALQFLSPISDGQGQQLGISLLAISILCNFKPRIPRCRDANLATSPLASSNINYLNSRGPSHRYQSIVSSSPRDLATCESNCWVLNSRDPISRDHLPRHHPCGPHYL